MDESPGLIKGSVSQLNQLNEIEKEEINRLRFISGKKHHYDSFAVEQHFADLKNLKFIEIVNNTGEFKCVIPAARLKADVPLSSPANTSRVVEFISEIGDENFNNLFFVSVTDHILTTDSIIEAYRKIKSSSQTRKLFLDKDVLPILNEKKEMIGTVDRQKLESNIAEEVEKQIP